MTFDTICHEKIEHPKSNDKKVVDAWWMDHMPQADFEQHLQELRDGIAYIRNDPNALKGQSPEKKKEVLCALQQALERSLRRLPESLKSHAAVADSEAFRHITKAVQKQRKQGGAAQSDATSRSFVRFSGVMDHLARDQISGQPLKEQAGIRTTPVSRAEVLDSLASAMDSMMQGRNQPDASGWTAEIRHYIGANQKLLDKAPASGFGRPSLRVKNVSNPTVTTRYKLCTELVKCLCDKNCGAETRYSLKVYLPESKGESVLVRCSEDFHEPGDPRRFAEERLTLTVPRKEFDARVPSGLMEGAVHRNKECPARIASWCNIL